MKRRWPEWAVSMPSVAWLLLFFVGPTLMVFAIAFRPADLFGGVGPGWTLATWRSLGNPNYPAIVWRTIWISAAATAACVMLAVPMGYHMARVSRRWRQALLLLTVVPFWTSFLVRIFAWKHLLHPDGFVHHALAAAGLVAAEGTLLYGPSAVLVVTVYTYLPFAILPVYAAAEKFDFHLLEAARDLGATQLRAFWSVFLPGIRRAIATAALIVFIPCLGSYVIPDVVGGPNSEMIGNKIAQRTFVDRNLPHASALSAVLTLAVLIPALGAIISQGRARRAAAVRETA